MSQQTITFTLIAEDSTDDVTQSDIAEIGRQLGAAVARLMFDVGALPFVAGRTPGEMRAMYSAAAGFDPQRHWPERWHVTVKHDDSSVAPVITLARHAQEGK